LVGSQLELFDGAGGEDSFFPPAARASLQHAAAELGVESRDVLHWLAEAEALACDVVWTCPPVARRRLDAAVHIAKYAKTRPKFGGDLRLRVRRRRPDQASVQTIQKGLCPVLEACA
jgi:hypothetical protein